ncbi:hypothetical protein BC829DRAFT_400300, partial [Chytridium lagenaria]
VYDAVANSLRSHEEVVKAEKIAEFMRMSNVKDVNVVRRVMEQSGDVEGWIGVREEKRRKVDEEIERCVEMAVDVFMSDDAFKFTDPSILTRNANLQARLIQRKEAAVRYFQNDVEDARAAAEMCCYKEIKQRGAMKGFCENMREMVEAAKERGDALREMLGKGVILKRKKMREDRAIKVIKEWFTHFRPDTKPDPVRPLQSLVSSVIESALKGHEKQFHTQFLAAPGTKDGKEVHQVIKDFLRPRVDDMLKEMDDTLERHVKKEE